MKRGASHERLVPPAPARDAGLQPCLCCGKPFKSPDRKRIRLCGACKKGSMSVFDAPSGNGCGRVVLGGG